MNLTSHVVVGAAVGYLTQNPILGFIAGYVSHHVIDTVPHTDGGSLHVGVANYAKDKRVIAIVAVDLALVIFFTFFLIGRIGPDLPMILGAFGGALPDLIDNVPFWTPAVRKKLPFFNKIHEFFHYTIEEPQYLWVGIVTQLILIALSLMILL